MSHGSMNLIMASLTLRILVDNYFVLIRLIIELLLLHYPGF